MQTDTNSSQFINALTELQFYAEESKKYQKEKEQDQEKRHTVSKTSQYDEKDPIPRAETVKEENPEGAGQNQKSEARSGHAEGKAEERENTSKEQNSRQKQPDTGEGPEVHKNTDKRTFLPSLSHVKANVPGKHTGMIRYTEYDPAAPAASIQAVETAIDAMKELQMLKRNHYPYLLVCIMDDGSRTQTKFRTLVEAQEQMEREMRMYIDRIEPIDINKVVYIDDGCGAHDYEPTPENELNPDGTFRHPSEINGTMHKLKEETKGIVYFETQNATARWDILNLDAADIGDKPNDPEFEAFIENAIREAREKEKKTEEQEEKAEKTERHARGKRK